MQTLTAAPSTSAGLEPFPWGRMLVLALAVFTTVTAEMLPAGLVPQIAADFEVGISTTGVLLSAWAVTIAVASLPLVRLLGRVERRTLLVVALAVMAVANVGVAVAPAFEVAIVARIVAAAAHGVFWSIVMVFAAGVAPRRFMGRAVAVTSAGGTAALLIGIPAGTALGQFVEWRVGFWGLAALMLAAAAVIRIALPALTPPPAAPRPAAGASRRDPSLGPVLLIGFVQLLVALAQYGTFTYIVPYLTEQADLAPQLVSVLLLVFGVGGLAGLVAVSLTADRWPRAAIVVALAVFAIALLTLGLASAVVPAVIAALVVWGIAIGALPALLLARTLRLASERATSLASAVAVVSFNLGIGAGAWLGGILTDGPGLAATAVVSGLVATLSLATTLGSFRFDRRTVSAATPRADRDAADASLSG